MSLPLFASPDAPAAPKPPADRLARARAALRNHWGYEDFRPGQAEAIAAFLDGRDTQVLLPTGGGKSLCYQVPALLRDGPTLVVSPLIALMQDQVEALRARGIRAVALHSGLSWDQVKAARDEARAAALIYASPEKVKTQRFRGFLRSIGVAAAAVDEAHCITEWGHDFRPDYRELAALKTALSDGAPIPVMACTATATPRVMEAIRSSLQLDEPAVVVGGFTRPNLAFAVEHVRGDTARAERVAELVREAGVGVGGRRGAEAASGRAKSVGPASGRAIVYAATRKRVQAIAKVLKFKRIKAGYYHAGRTAGARELAHQRFVDGSTPVLVATSAYGMGIDRPDIRLVVHAETPGTFEAWVQEAGRAGRDGLPSRCVLLYSPKDAVTQARLRTPVKGGEPHPGVQAGWDALMSVVFGTGCREQAIVAHFGGQPGAPCGRCDACLAPDAVRATAEQTREQIADARAKRTAKQRADNAVDLDASQRQTVLAFVGALTKPLGRGLVAKGLRGSSAKAVQAKRLPDNPHFGALRGVPEVAVYKALDDLLAEGILVRKGRKYPTIWLPDKPVRPRKSPAEREAARAAREAELTPRGRLRERLRSYRSKEARRRRVKPYQIFPNATLTALLDERPVTTTQLLAIPGMGVKRVQKHGAAILDILRAWEG